MVVRVVPAWSYVKCSFQITELECLSRARQIKCEPPGKHREECVTGFF